MAACGITLDIAPGTALGTMLGVAPGIAAMPGAPVAACGAPPGGTLDTAGCGAACGGIICCGGGGICVCGGGL